MLPKSIIFIISKQILNILKKCYNLQVFIGKNVIKQQNLVGMIWLNLQHKIIRNCTKTQVTKFCWNVFSTKNWDESKKPNSVSDKVKVKF